MIYQCSECGRSTFEVTCQWCSAHGEDVTLGSESRCLTPLDPSFYPDFQYQSKGLLKDILGKKKEQAQLNTVLNDVLRKFAALKQPYFMNFIHTTREQEGLIASSGMPGARINGEYSDLELFREVLIRKGFSELEGFPLLLNKLLMTASFGSVYAGFSREISRHIKPTFGATLISWIEESGTVFRNDLALFLFFFWENEFEFPDVEYNQHAADTFGTPLVPKAEFKKHLELCEIIYFDILVDRLAAQLEHFNPGGGKN